MTRALGPRAFAALAFVALLLAGAAAGAPAAAPIKVIIDTDVAMGYPGHDVDDGLVLLLALNSPELEIVGVTAAWGNYTQDKTFAKARELLAATGHSDIPCLAGASGPGDRGRPTPASRFIAHAVTSRPGEISILAIGTLTNLATAIGSDPEVAPAISRIVSMGGTLAPPGRWPLGAMIDLNYGADVQSAKQVMQSGVPFTCIHSALCRQTVITPDRYRRLIETAPFQRELIARETRSWFRLNLIVSPKPGTPGMVPWDVSALAYLIHPEFFTANWMRAEIDDRGFGYKTVVAREEGLAPGTGINAPSRVDADQFWAWFFERI
jgi:purine nucleosidase